MKIAVLITCHNRREQTLGCLRALFAQQFEEKHSIQVWLVDDGSKDQTGEAVAEEFPQVRQIQGSGDLFWCGGMALAWSRASASDADVFLWLNDDVTLRTHALDALQRVAAQNPLAIVVGSCACPESGRRTYGGLRRPGSHPGKVFPIDPGESPTRCDTFEGNIVWVPARVFAQIGPLAQYRHAMGDIDYGYRATSQGISVLVAPGFLGVCSANSRRNTWEDPRLARGERLRKLRSTKGLPSRDWWRFCRRNGGWRAPLYFVTPFLRVLAGR